MKVRGIGILLVLHGSRDKECKRKITELKNALAELTAIDKVSIGFMQFTQPSIRDGLNELITEDCDKIIVLPLFVTYGRHLKEGIPKILGINGFSDWKEIKWNGKNVSIYYCLDPLINSHLIPLMVANKVNTILNKLNLKQPPRGSETEGEEILNRSLRYIAIQLKDYLEKFNKDERKLIMRAVHATGDLEVAKLIEMSEDAVAVGVESIKSGKNIFTDVKMVAAGIKRDCTSKFKCKVFCYIDDERAPRVMRELRVTRSSAAVTLAIEDGILDDSIVVIGNAPTALMTLIHKVRERVVKPALIIATPVGFINAAEAKAKLKEIPVPYITLLGTRGGSTIATSILNGIIEICEEKAS